MKVVPGADTRSLNLWKQHLGEVPDYVCALEQLETLVPASLFALPRFQKLDLRWVPSLSMPRGLAHLEERGCLVYR